MRRLTIDIETSPNLADVWSLWNVNVGLSQLREASKVMCFAAKFHGDKKVHYYSDFHHGHGVMIEKAHGLLEEADAVIHWNGARFDIPHLNREFMLAELGPPAPFVQIDLLKTVRKVARFSSNKLDHVAQQLGVGSKVKHEGHSLWTKCMAGDAAAWNRMRRYNRQDVVLTEQLYDRLLPWIVGHPSVPLFDGIQGNACPKCTSTHLQSRGYRVLAAGRYHRFQCMDCKSWSNVATRESGVPLRSIS